jgi:DegV family protein with EDD domain
LGGIAKSKEVMMKRVAVMTDTVASVPPNIAREYGIKVIPFHVIMDGKSYIETEIDKDQFYGRLRQKENLPTTSAPSVGEYLEAYQELSQRAEAILHISMTSRFTMAYGAATAAKELARERLPKTTTEIVDSQTVESSELLIVLEAARAAQQGKSLDEVIQIVNNMIPRVNQLSTRDTLFYLDRLGRIFEAKSWAEAESKNSFRAIVEIDASTGGITKPVARAKTKTQIMNKMVSIAGERAGGKKLHAAIAHANAPRDAERLKQLVLAQLQCDEFYVVDVPPVAATQNGQGLIEFGFYSSD